MKKYLLSIICLLCIFLQAYPKKESPHPCMMFANDVNNAQSSYGDLSADSIATLINYYANKSLESGIQMSKELPLYAGGDDEVITLTDTVTGGVAGYMYQGYTVVDSASMDSMWQWIDRGILLYPDRLDLYLGRMSYMLYVVPPADYYESILKELEHVMAMDEVHNGKWLWTNDKPLPDGGDKIFMRIQDDFKRYIDAGLLDKAFLLATRAIETWPERAEYANDMAIVYYIREEYGTALMWFKKALSLNPKDELIKHNIKQVKALIRGKK